MRAAFGTADKAVRAMRMAPGDPQALGVADYFQSPMGEEEVAARLKEILEKAARLAAARKRQRTAAAVQGVRPAVQQGNLAKRHAAEIASLCRPGMTYYRRGLVGFAEPAVPLYQRLYKK